MKKKVTRKFKSGGLHERHVVATWKLEMWLLHQQVNYKKNTIKHNCSNRYAELSFQNVSVFQKSYSKLTTYKTERPEVSSTETIVTYGTGKYSISNVSGACCIMVF
jgi:hypothetical protein